MGSLIETEFSHDKLGQIADQCAQHLQHPFCLWLQGPLGAGKTTLVGALLRSLGLPCDTAVTSPTFTYMNDYRIQDRRYAHFDFYRGDQDPSIEELALDDPSSFFGYFIEWPGQMAPESDLKATHLMSLGYGSSEQSRTLLLTTA